MTVQTNQPQPTATQENKPSDKELNFRMLEQKYQKERAQERAARLEAERIAQERSNAALQDADNDDEPYVDRKKLDKTLQRFGEKSRQDTQTEIQKAVQIALQEERRGNWLKNNADFYEVLQHADKFAQKDPELAESILEMPEGFERQKLVYKSIKAMGLHRPDVKQPSIQDTIDAKRRGPYYQPSGVGAAPYESAGNFSPDGQKQSYQKMQELKNRLRIG